MRTRTTEKGQEKAHQSLSDDKKIVMHYSLLSEMLGEAGEGTTGASSMKVMISLRQAKS